MTEISHVVFGIAASAKLWEQRKNYIKIWYKQDQMRGIVWLDKPLKIKNTKKTNNTEGLPPMKMSADTSRLAYTNHQGHRST